MKISLNFLPEIGCELNFFIYLQIGVDASHQCELQNNDISKCDFNKLGNRFVYTTLNAWGIRICITLGWFDLETVLSDDDTSTHIPNVLVFEFETDDFGKASQCVFVDPTMRIPDRWRVNHNLPEFDYIPLDKNDPSRPYLSKTQKKAKIDYSVLLSQDYTNVVDQFLAFIQQDYFRNYTILVGFPLWNFHFEMCFWFHCAVVTIFQPENQWENPTICQQSHNGSRFDQGCCFSL